MWPFFGAGLHFFQIPIVCQGFHFCSGDDVDATFRQYAHEQAAHLFVNGGQDVWQHFDNRDVGTQGVKHAGQFHTDGATADADDAIRYFGQIPTVVAVDDVAPIDARKWRHNRH